MQSIVLFHTYILMILRLLKWVYTDNVMKMMCFKTCPNYLYEHMIYSKM